MTKFTLATLAFLVASCAPAKTTVSKVKAALTPPTPVKAEDIILSALAEPANFCYTTKFGSPVFSDGSVPCPPQAEIEPIYSDIDRQFKIKDVQWEKHTLFYTAKVIDCGGIVAMGCTQAYSDDTNWTIVSLYYPWRRATLRHELTHVGLFWIDAQHMRHFCLDNPELCNEAGTGLSHGD